MDYEITVEEVKAKLDAGEEFTLIDVREPWEHDTAALPGGVLIPLAELPGRVEEVRPPPGAVTTCWLPSRSKA